jgi:hypothetical protein
MPEFLVSIAALSSKGQFTNPAEVCADLRLNTGDMVSLETTEDGSHRFCPLKGDIRPLAGMLKYDGPLLSVEQMNQFVLDEVTDRRRATP